MHAIAIHGGPGTLAPADLTPDNERAYRAGLERALRAGFAVLDSGGSALDASVSAVRVLEDDPALQRRPRAVVAANGAARARCLRDGRSQLKRRGSHRGAARAQSDRAARLVMERSPH